MQMSVRQIHVFMRNIPDNFSEVVSELIVGEMVRVIEKQNLWLCVESRDGYRGWVLENSLTTAIRKNQQKITAKIAPVYAEKSMLKGPIAMLPYGANVTVVGQEKGWNEVLLFEDQKCFVQKGFFLQENPITNWDAIISFGKEFLGTPYVWGGRSSFGIDCSGFIQLLFQRCNMTIERDAKDQYKSPLLTSCDNPTKGDVIFWESHQQKIVHVGLMISHDTFLHATSKEKVPCVQISSVENWVKRKIFPKYDIKRLHQKFQDTFANLEPKSAAVFPG